MPEFSRWDVALLLCVSVMGTAVAYLRHPEHKALAIVLPIPFTLAVLALGRPIDATNALALCTVFVYVFGVWLLHARLKVPIVPSIVASATTYSLIGWLVARFVPQTPATFYSSCVLALALGLAIPRWLPHRHEPHFRSPLPVYLKFPAIVLVVFVVIVLKRYIGGFVTVFPMVGVITSYEARHSLWTIVRRIPSLMVAMAPTLVTIRLAHAPLGLGAALALGWPVFLTTIGVIMWRQHLRLAQTSVETPEEDDEEPANGLPVETPVAEGRAVDA